MYSFQKKQNKTKKKACSVNLIGLSQSFSILVAAVVPLTKSWKEALVLLGGLRALDLFFGVVAYSEHSQSVQILKKYF